MLGKFTKKQAAPKYSKEELVSHAQVLFNCQPEVVVGALSDNTQDDYTIEEVQTLIQQFNQRMVK
ncbi:hypothetical protein E0485_23065 [Paenibacillus albiflavus]|uniref:YqzN/YkzM domain-containing protein n=1 Tax=Paenibacillus albiflavus TaxID=2545760 RepID=A0A4R4E3Q6_9BACL|nr:hypothetical protein [Paenibacillus albiflavus]TCZ70971.1 hypothetical protein E0485_23065 [Paenibacillus albiflavus]